MKEFDSRVAEEIGSYVYALIDNSNNLKREPFYVGKGRGNRVFQHASGIAEANCKDEKIERIKSILDSGYQVEHIIIQHGLNDEESFLVETALIDFLKFIEINLTNRILGRGSRAYGLMTAEEVQRMYMADPLDTIDPDCVIFNINKRYKEQRFTKSFYDVTRGKWKMADWRTKNAKYALSEYRGFIVEVFKIISWEKTEGRWQFCGDVADESIRSKYLNKRIEKKRGAANPVRYCL